MLKTKTIKITRVIMAATKSKPSSTSTFRAKSRKKRPGVHSKKKSSTSKKATNYTKSYRGQGR
jgi:hypothetical protein